MTKTLTNRHGNEIAIGQLWTDDPRRTTVRTLRIDDLVREGNLGARAVCTVIRSHDTETGQVTEPGRVVSIKVDSDSVFPAGWAKPAARPANPSRGQRSRDNVGGV